MKINLKSRCFICLSMILLTISWRASAARPDSPDQLKDTISRSTSIYFAFDVSDDIETIDQAEMDDFVAWVKKHKDSPVRIYGWCDRIGPDEYNSGLSIDRAITAKYYLIDRGVTNPILLTAMGKDSSVPDHLARRATMISSISAPAEPKPQERPKAPASKPQERASDVAHAAEPEPATAEQTAAEPAQDEPQEDPKSRFSLRTNLLYWLACTPNIGFEWNPADTSLGVVVNGGYAPLGGDNWEHSFGGWFASPELRYYLGQSKQWFVGAQFFASGFNVKLSDRGYQGNVFAGGITGGYKIELNDTFDMDFNLGIGYGSFNHDVYYHEQDINIRLLEDTSKSTIMPIQAGVNLIWKIR
ncbi:MAG: DUF3575 domain-containing protein [Rikenellaceae bacterium]